ncbi:MAG: LysM peptidoglycan-binding domain-containing protein [Bdellovibrionales bacterium]
MKKEILIVSILLGASSIKAQSETPNYEFEQRLSTIYQDLSGKRVDQQQFYGDLADREIETYRILRGDNLWDLSKTIFGTGFFWPKLWQLNPKVTNPHEIEPGLELSFVEGNLNEAPSLVISEEKSQATSLANNKIEITEDELLELKWEEPELPPVRQDRPVLQVMPPSIFDWNRDSVYLENSKDIERQKARIEERKKFYFDYVLVDEKPTSIGKIFSTEASMAEYASTYQYVYVKLDSAEIGEELLVIKYLDPLILEDVEYGTQTMVQGIIQVTEMIDASKNLYKALVVKNNNEMQIGSEIIRSAAFVTVWENDGNFSSASGKIIGGRFDNQRKNMALGSVVYINRGSDQGVSNGQFIQVLRNGVIRNLQVGNADTPKIGTLRIGYVGKSVSTAIVVSSKDSIFVKDFVGAAIEERAPVDATEITSDLESEIETTEEEFAENEDSDSEEFDESEFSEDEEEDDDFSDFDDSEEL